MPSIKKSQRTVQLLLSRERIGPTVPVLPNVIYPLCMCVENVYLIHLKCSILVRLSIRNSVRAWYKM